MKSISESKFRKGVLDVVLKVLGFSGGFDGLVKRRRQRKIDKELDDTKREQISEIFEEYLTHIPTTIQETNLLSNHLKSKVSAQAFTTLQPYFNIDKTVFTSAIKDKLTDINNINPKTIKEAAGNAYINTTTETEMVNGKQKQIKKETIDVNKFERDKDKIIEKYLIYMTKALSTKPTFLQSIDTSAADQGSNTVAFTIVSSLFINKDNVIDGIEAKVFLPEVFMNGKERIAPPLSIPETQPLTTNPEAQSQTTSPETELTAEQKQTMNTELQRYHSPLTADMLVTSAKAYEIPVSYLAAVIKNDSSYGTAGIGARTNNPGNV
ncbi:MAG: hypothetical protein LBI53_02805 [Candidatus Peribacteria bacterium]|jgi:hypothetical protein|nr:hypothetical protein [Candidatus Peribacteria bacterium]